MCMYMCLHENVYTTYIYIGVGTMGVSDRLEL